MEHLKEVPPLLTKAMNRSDTSDSPTSLAVNAGDLWAMSWNGDFLGLVLIAAVKDGFVLGWPVTLPDDPAFAPALVADPTPLGFPLFIWPTREVGLGMHLLDRPLGRLLAPHRIQPIAWAMDDGDDPGIPLAPGSSQEPQHQARDQWMVERWAELCFHAWPRPDHHFLSQERVQSAGGSSAMAAQVLGMGPVGLRPIWTGVRPIADEQVSALAASLHTSPEALLGADPLEPLTARLMTPRYKASLVAAALQAGMSEELARDAAREEYALAARDDAATISDKRISDAIKRVAARGHQGDD